MTRATERNVSQSASVGGINDADNGLPGSANEASSLGSSQRSPTINSAATTRRPLSPESLVSYEQSDCGSSKTESRGGANFVSSSSSSQAKTEQWRVKNPNDPNESFREEKLRIVNCLVTMDDEEILSDSVGDRLTSSSRGADTNEITMGSHRFLQVAEPSKRAGRTSEAKAGDAGIPGPDRLQGNSASSAMAMTATGEPGSTEATSSKSFKERQLQAATRVLRETPTRRRRVLSSSVGEPLFAPHNLHSTNNPSSRNDDVIRHPTVDEDHSAPLQSTTIADETLLRDPEPAPMYPDEVTDNPPTLNGGRKLTWTRVLTHTLLVVSLLVISTVVVLVVWTPNGNGDGNDPADNGESNIAGLQENELWNQCQRNASGSKISGVPSSQKSVYEEVRLVLHEHVPDDLEIESCDPTNMALLMLAVTPRYLEQQYEVQLTRFALLCLYFATQGNEWSVAALWRGITESGYCEWDGVVCNDFGVVVGLDLGLANLKGELPSELAVLTGLESIDMRHGSLEGTLPSELYRDLSHLEVLYLTDNFLTEISTEIGLLRSLTTFSIGENRLEGTTIPSEVGLLSSLVTFGSYSCDLEGPLPTEFGACTRLELLLLYRNSITGTIPTEIERLTNLLRLEIEANSLVGPIPTALFGFTQLETLFIGRNSLQAPPDLPTLVLSNLTNLLSLSLASLSVTGTIPATELNALAPTMDWLDLQDNEIRGTIPTEIGGLTHLTELTLNSNLLTGTIPSELGKLTELLLLRFDDNDHLDMNVPPELQRLIDLDIISVPGHW